MPTSLTPARTAVLTAVALVGGVGLNGVYLYQALRHPDLHAAALRNPVAAVFLLESLLLTALGTWAVAQSRLRRPGWFAFLAMAIAGSLAFAVPAFALLHLRRAASSGPDDSDAADDASDIARRRAALAGVQQAASAP